MVFCCALRFLLFGISLAFARNRPLYGVARGLRYPRSQYRLQVAAVPCCVPGSLTLRIGRMRPDTEHKARGNLPRPTRSTGRQIFSIEPGQAAQIGFAAVAGVFLFIVILKLGNPVILDAIGKPPQNWLEVLYQSWPLKWGYWASILSTFGCFWFSRCSGLAGNSFQPRTQSALS
jgi:hypothetical protein